MNLTLTRQKILKCLRSNARVGFSEIARSQGIPVTTVFDNYDVLSSEGFIRRHVPLIDFKKLGFNYRSFIFLKSKEKERLFDFLQEHGSVNSVFKISGYDLLVDCVFPGISEFYLFLDSLQNFNIDLLEHHDIIDVIKAEEFYSA